MAEIRSREFWAQHVAACAASGLSRAAYCRRHDLSYWTFNDWRRRVESAQPRPVSTAQHQSLVPVVLSSTRPTAAMLELRVGDQVRLSLPASVDAAWLGSLLRSVAAC
jgi:transposase-like protein